MKACLCLIFVFLNASRVSFGADSFGVQTNELSGYVPVSITQLIEHPQQHHAQKVYVVGYADYCDGAFSLTEKGAKMRGRHVIHLSPLTHDTNIIARLKHSNIWVAGVYVAESKTRNVYEMGRLEAIKAFGFSSGDCGNTNKQGVLREEP